MKPWIEWTLTHQRPDGAIGPPKNADWWPNMIMLKVLTQYQEATADPRVDPVHGRATSPTRRRRWTASPLKEWAIYRWHDEAPQRAVALQPHRRRGAARLGAASCTTQGFDWEAQFATSSYTDKVSRPDAKLNTHVVNNAMAMKAAASGGSSPATPRDRDAVGIAARRRWIGITGSRTAIFSGDEHYAGRDPSQGTELCAVVEAMFSLEHLICRSSAMRRWATASRRSPTTRCRRTFDGDMWAHQYDQQPTR